MHSHRNIAINASFVSSGFGKLLKDLFVFRTCVLAQHCDPSNLRQHSLIPVLVAVTRN